ncbi:MAG: UDP-N-acetylmuramoyl-L-alanyl-D-glutamate--2,6-diaminopimelate ligase, partial [Clostridia bacterium]|nr:UDP-N-acetylmuramoyl-L-alanyl-D-glutamate--2,6-diaminopimelate ligase [Clostridia bacterium]
MKLGELLSYIRYKEFTGDKFTEISGLCTDSQKVNEGDLFFCYEGENYDSHDFALKAVQAGAVALV